LSRWPEVTLSARRALGCGDEAWPLDLAPAPPTNAMYCDVPAPGFAFLKASCCLLAKDKRWLSRACCSRSASPDKLDNSLATSAAALSFFTGELYTIFEGFRSIENKKIPTKMNKNKPRSDLRDAKQQAREIRSTYPCRSHSGNVHMNVVGVVVLASPPRDLIRSKRHNGRRL
jgi:hypothetical protein